MCSHGRALGEIDWEWLFWRCCASTDESVSGCFRFRTSKYVMAASDVLCCQPRLASIHWGYDVCVLPCDLDRFASACTEFLQTSLYVAVIETGRRRAYTGEGRWGVPVGDWRCVSQNRVCSWGGGALHLWAGTWFCKSVSALVCMCMPCFALL